ncbi:hypothetical protein CVU82_02130 [Candidatus Falkowbacteria bacterium HGW-Falkowbacteria-1]|uniref:Uncharacterized protein n=1 Tax=Candidatus Falkowbacteria bacterium HGW-Falkowbacteria-1 TaxID=2013768 RepID=A0A2N2E9L0_9BACT|nr:MAG: hypothetical protein CVU82_02130 [Candidatus Falkowbacteria bacterium HGW-Falkowbacteria-1]
MKKIIFFLTFALLLTSCEKEFVFDEKAPGDSTYDWPGYPVPRPVEELGRTAASGWSNVYDYTFRMHLDGSQSDPNPLTIETFAIPHVGPHGVTIYTNVTNDATYTISKIENGWIYYTIRSEAGNTLKYNLAKKTGTSSYTWFLRYGLTTDDGTTNMVTFVAN